MNPFSTWSRLAAVLLVAAAPTANGWGGRLHMDISRAAARAVPDEMAGWRKFARLMADYSIQPDLWKEFDAAENSRHFIDLESYAPLAVSNLPRDFSALEAPAGRGKRRGSAPWVILDLQEKLSRAMASTQWVEAARIAAAQGHYVADLHQPLHTTENYDGQDSGQGGVHLRWEVEMPGVFWRTHMLPEVRAESITDLWPALLGWIEESHTRIPEILSADDQAARRTDFNVESRAYYTHLWQASSNVFIEQAHRAACRLAGLWYTAWLDAGRPKIPPPPDSLSEASIWKPLPPTGEHPSWPFLVAFGIVALLILLLSLRRGSMPRPRP